MSDLFGKTPISALQEYTAKKGIASPIYEILECDDEVKSFRCVVEVLDEMAEGFGRSKREAKHEAAAEIIKKLKISHKDLDIPQTHHEHIPTSDAVAELRDICVQRDHPLPAFELVQQVGPPEAPEFTMRCTVASIVRFAVSSTKKGARQLVAQKLIDIIQSIPLNDHEMELVTLDDALKQEEDIIKKKFTTYKEFLNSDLKDPPGTLLKDRHNYFKKFDTSLKNRVKEILRESRISDHETIDNILKVLNIKYNTHIIHTKTGESKLFIELLTDIDVVFFGHSDEIYKEMLEYFEVML